MTDTHKDPPMTRAPQTADFAAIKAKQQAAWSSGNYSKVGITRP